MLIYSLTTLLYASPSSLYAPVTPGGWLKVGGGAVSSLHCPTLAYLTIIARYKRSAIGAIPQLCLTAASVRGAHGGAPLRGRERRGGEWKGRGGRLRGELPWLWGRGGRPGASPLPSPPRWVPGRAVLCCAGPDPRPPARLGSARRCCGKRARLGSWGRDGAEGLQPVPPRHGAPAAGGGASARAPRWLSGLLSPCPSLGTAGLGVAAGGVSAGASPGRAEPCPPRPSSLLPS